MRRIGAGILGLLALTVGVAETTEAHAQSAAEWVIRIMDDSGAVPAGAEAFAVGSGDTGTTGGLWKHADSKGIVRFRRGEVFSPAPEQNGSGEAVDVIVRARGFAPAVVPRLRPTASGNGDETRDVVLERGMRAEFVLRPGKGTLPPDLRPVLTDAPHVKAAWRSLTDAGGETGGIPGRRPVHQLALGVPEVAGGGRFAFQVPENPPDLYLLVEAPGFLRQFQAGPFRRTQLGGGPIEVRLPDAGGVEAVIHPPTGSLQDGETTAPGSADREMPREITLLRQLDKSSRGSGAAVRVLTLNSTETATVRAADLAPGDYKLVIRGGESSRDLERSIRVSAGKVSRTELGSRQAAAAPVPRFPELRLVNGAGEPVPGAEIAVRKAGSREMEGTWHPAEGGRVVLKTVSDFAPFGSGEKVEGLYDILARAPGYGWTTATAEVRVPSAPASSPEPVTIVLPPGKRVEIALRSSDGKPFAEPLPLAVFTPAWAEAAWQSTRVPWSPMGAPKPLFTLSSVEPMGVGRYAVTIPAVNGATSVASDSAPDGEFYLFVNGTGVLRGWQGGPYSTPEIAAAGKLEVELPKPAAVTASFMAPPEGFREGETSFTACGLRLLRRDVLKSAGQEVTAWTEVASAEAKDTRVTTSVTDLAPGEYRLEVGSGERRDPFHGLWTGDYRRTTETVLVSGENHALSLVFKPFDPASLKGDAIAVVKVSRPDGKPVGGKRYTLETQTREDGLKVAAEGTFPDSGVVEIPGLRTISEPVLMAELPKDFELPFYILKVDGDMVGSLQMFEQDRRSGEARPPAGGGKRKDFEFQLPPAVGEPAPDIELVEFGTGRAMRLSDMKGQVVFLDFWASWCGPCQKPMEHNQEIMTRRGGDWKGKAVILGASIDEDLKTVTEHVKKNGWEAVRQTWCPPAGEENAGFKAPAPRAYAVSGVPTALLIDKDGKIVWRGHPSGFEIEREIDKLIGAR